MDLARLGNIRRWLEGRVKGQPWGPARVQALYRRMVLCDCISRHFPEVALCCMQTAFSVQILNLILDLSSRQTASLLAFLP